MGDMGALASAAVAVFGLWYISSLIWRRKRDSVEASPSASPERQSRLAELELLQIRAAIAAAFVLVAGAAAYVVGVQSPILFYVVIALVAISSCVYGYAEVWKIIDHARSLRSNRNASRGQRTRQ